MYICPKCYFQTEEPAKFCPHCGTGMNNVEPIAPTPNPGPTYTPYNPAPTYSYAPASKPEVSIGKKITGMALAVVGLIFALIAFGYAMMAADAGWRYAEIYATSGIVCVIFGLPLSIVGLAISSSASADDRMKGFGIAGKICGIIGIVLCAIAFLVSVGNL